MTAQIANKKGTVKSIQPAHWVHAGQLTSIGQSFPIIQLRINATIGIAGGNGNFLESGEMASKSDTSALQTVLNWRAILDGNSINRVSGISSSKATIETSDTVVILAMTDCTVVLLAVNSSGIMAQ